MVSMFAAAFGVAVAMVAQAAAAVHGAGDTEAPWTHAALESGATEGHCM